jgi:hypothetical protein
MTDPRKPSRASTDVVCIACGETLPRGDAREYDKYGDRWDREGKAFEYLCKPCHRECCHQPRNGLEELLARVEDEHADARAFVTEYYALVAEDVSTES